MDVLSCYKTGDEGGDKVNILVLWEEGGKGENLVKIVPIFFLFEEGMLYLLVKKTVYLFLSGADLWKQRKYTLCSPSACDSPLGRREGKGLFGNKWNPNTAVPPNTTKSLRCMEQLPPLVGVIYDMLITSLPLMGMAEPLFVKSLGCCLRPVLILFCLFTIKISLSMADHFFLIDWMCGVPQGPPLGLICLYTFVMLFSSYYKYSSLSFGK